MSEIDYIQMGKKYWNEICDYAIKNDIDPWKLVRIENKLTNKEIVLYNHPDFTQYDCNYTIQFAIVAINKIPIFITDIVYNEIGEKCIVVGIIESTDTLIVSNTKTDGLQFCHISVVYPVNLVYDVYLLKSELQHLIDMLSVRSDYMSLQIFKKLSDIKEE